MTERDTILAVLQSDIGLIGLVLVFAGLLLSKAESYQTRRGDKFRYFAVFSLVPILGAAISAWISIMAIEGDSWAVSNSLLSLKIVLALTVIYAIIGLLVSAFL